MKRLSSLRAPLLFITLALIIGAIFHYPLVLDDPFITYRYAHNLITGNGFVYNADERVLSTTTPLYALLLGALGFFYRDIPALGFWLSVVSLGACAYFIFRIAEFFKQRVGGIVAGMLLVSSPALLLTFGLETNFYLTLATAAIFFYLTQRVTIAFLLLALLTLTRNDGIILTVILATHFLYTQRESFIANRVSQHNWRIVRPFAIYVVILAPWLFFATLYFGAPFPFTLAAKIAQAASGLWDSFAIGFVKWARENFVWLAPQFALAVVGAVWGVRKRSMLLLVGVWAIAHLVAYSMLKVAFYAWYVAPFIPALCLCAGIGVQVCAEWITARVRAKDILQFAVVIFFTASGIALNLRAAVDAGMLQPAPKTEAYTRAAEWLARNTEPNATVDALEVGLIGYFDERRTYDFVGLVDPTRVPYLRTQKFADGVRRRAANYVIAIPPDEWLPEDVWFKDAYRIVQEIRVKNFYSNRPLVIYQRADAGRAPIESRTVNAAFEKWIELQTVELFAHEIARSENLPLRLNLRALKLAPVPENWKFTMQLVGAENRVVAQTDNYFPARFPEDGKPFADYQGIPIPPDAPTGEYELILAMYDVQNNERLSLYGNDGNEVGDFVPLGHITIR